MNISRVNRFQLGALFLSANLLGAASADPHYVQALHPYWGDDAVYARYLQKFEGPVDHDVSSTLDEDGRAVYLYQFSVEIPSAHQFSIELTCPGATSYQLYGVVGEKAPAGVAAIESVSPDPVAANEDALITADGWLSWPLAAGAGRQAGDVVLLMESSRGARLQGRYNPRRDQG